MELIPLETSRTLALPGITLTQRGLIISEDAAPEIIDRTLGFLREVEGSSLFWWGDFLNAAEARHGEKYAEALSRSSYSYASLRTAKWVCAKLDLSMRIDKLGFAHHQTALAECDGIATEAIKWLQRAEAGEMTVSQLRQAIRKSHAVESRNDAGASNASVAATRGFAEFARWFPASVGELPAESREAWRGDLRPVVAAWLRLYSPDEALAVVRELLGASGPVDARLI